MKNGAINIENYHMVSYLMIKWLKWIQLALANLYMNVKKGTYTPRYINESLLSNYVMLCVLWKI